MELVITFTKPKTLSWSGRTNNHNGILKQPILLRRQQCGILGNGRKPDPVTQYRGEEGNCKTSTLRFMGFLKS
jgi:hypothetical protein